MAGSIPQGSKRRLVLTYIGLVGLPVAILLAVLWLPSTQATPPAGPPRRVLSEGAPNLALSVAQLSLIIVLTRAVGSLAQWFRQPRVVGEVVAGIVLGPSLFGWVAPGLSSMIFPPASFGVLHVLSQLGLVLFMFMVGLEVNGKEWRQHGPSVILISHASVAAPMALGSLLAIYLYPRLSDASVGFAGFALFIAAAMSVTAFPVLARILSERKLLHSRMGTMAIACAAINDVTGWCVLACIVVQVRAVASSVPVWMTLAGLGAFLALMLALRKPLGRIERAYLAQGELEDNLQALLLLILLTSALVTELLGLHLLFGAFIAGAIMPKNPQFVAYLIGKLESLTGTLVAPLVLRIYGPAHCYRTGKGHCRLVALRIDHRRRSSRETGRHEPRCPPGRIVVAGFTHARLSDEYAWPDGAGGAEHRPGHQSNLARFVFDDGGNGHRDHHDDGATAPLVLSTGAGKLILSPPANDSLLETYRAARRPVYHQRSPSADGDRDPGRPPAAAAAGPQAGTERRNGRDDEPGHGSGGAALRLLVPRRVSGRCGQAGLASPPEPANRRGLFWRNRRGTARRMGLSGGARHSATGYTALSRCSGVRFSTRLGVRTSGMQPGPRSSGADQFVVSRGAISVRQPLRPGNTRSALPLGGGDSAFRVAGSQETAKRVLARNFPRGLWGIPALAGYAARRSAALRALVSRPVGLWDGTSHRTVPIAAQASDGVTMT